jgi:hypothetical protein
MSQALSITETNQGAKVSKVQFAGRGYCGRSVAVTKLLSLLLAVGLVSSLLALLWLIDIVSQRPNIPTQTRDGAFVEIILQRKKPNHIDDFCLPCFERPAGAFPPLACSLRDSPMILERTVV